MHKRVLIEKSTGKIIREIKPEEPHHETPAGTVILIKAGGVQLHKND